MVHSLLYRDSAFVKLASEEKAADLLHLASRGRKLDHGDHLCLNRYLTDTAYRHATGDDLFHTVQAKFDAVIVSDAGKKFAVSRQSRGGGHLRIAIPASEILLNRVWELENDHFQCESDFVFALMSLTFNSGRGSDGIAS